ILQSLNRYYEILSQDPESDIAPPGYSTVEVSFALELSAQGELLNIIPLFEQIQRGNKIDEKPKRMIVPEQFKHTNKVSAFFLCDNSAYVLGISDRGDEYGIKRFEAFRQFNKELLSKADCDPARAVATFLDGYDPRTAKQFPEIARHWEVLLKGGRLVFMLNGEYIHQNSKIVTAWDVYKAGSAAIFGQCLVTGEIAPIARLHPPLQGVRNANSTGASLVSFNERAYESYNRFKGQGLNSPVSEKAAVAYSKALGYLLSRANPNKKFTIGDTTIVYWAESRKPEYANTFASLFEPELVEVEPPTAAENQPGRDKKAEQTLKAIAGKVKRVQAMDVSRLTENLDESTRFYVLGLAPNAGRISVRFFLAEPFGKIVERMMRHYHDLEIVKEYADQPTYLTIRHILDETVSKKASDPQASPLMAGSVFRSILENASYPAALYFAVVNRIRADVDDSKKGIKKISYARAAIIKAYLIRKYRHQLNHPIQEVLVMSLNEQSTRPAYVLGRLFAVLEKVQKEAVNPEATIKDRYFTSACASPASVFPVLLRLSQHHISKAEYGYASDNRIEAILNLLDVEKNPIPSHLSLDEQGVFVLGYYHQRAAFYVSKADKNSAESTSSEIQ
ncbi:MAG: type I-C CRISPR-associated protein Cas8c/Csd1, partial [Anaerolineaceae bacterium]|nr:type I-C CRISPR-associated protein Cas8c/Csd1 [Anaerolineaceae bacterium]